MIRTTMHVKKKSAIEIIENPKYVNLLYILTMSKARPWLANTVIQIGKVSYYVDAAGHI